MNADNDVAPMHYMYIYISISLYTYKNIFTNRDIIREAAGYFEKGVQVYL